MPVAMFDLELYYGSQKLLLQNDNKLPASRSKANTYRIICAYYYHGALAVVIEYDEYGFEGMNRRQMIVTGIIKTKDLPMQDD